MEWDASRVSAALPSGVGFLGAGLIWKGQLGAGAGAIPHVRGLTTAASIWISAAVGLACGGGLYYVAAYSTAAALTILKFGPQMSTNNESNSDDDSDEEEIHEKTKLQPNMGNIQGMSSQQQTKNYGTEKSTPSTPLLKDKARPSRSSSQASALFADQ